MRLMTAALVLALAVAGANPAFSADDPYAGWTPEQLKAKIGALQRQLDAAKGAPASAAPVAAAAANLKIDDFEGAEASIGGMWWVGSDAGSKIGPDPFVAAKGGAEGKQSGRVSGKLGKNEDPWAWAAMSINLPNGDLRGYKALQFWAKGDGKTHNVKLEKKSVTDYAHFSATFVAGPKWAKVTIPLADFKQADWGKQVDAAMNDVEKLSFYPTTFESTFDFSVDGITLLK